MNHARTPNKMSPTNPPNAPPMMGPSASSALLCLLLSPACVVGAAEDEKKLVEVYVTMTTEPSARVDDAAEVITVAFVGDATEVGAEVVVVLVVVPPLVGHVEKRVAVGEDVVRMTWNGT